MEKQKCLNLGPKMPYLGIFDLELKKTIVIFEISTLEFVKNESLTQKVNFGIGSAFSKGLGPGLGPLYNVCPHIIANTFKYKSEDYFLHSRR